MRLMEMAKEYRALLDAVEIETGGGETELMVPSTGEVVSQDAFLAALYAIEDSIEGKVDGYGSVIEELERSAAEIRDLEKRYAARRQALERRAEQVRSRLSEGLVEAKRDKVKTLRFTVWLAAETKELVILDAAALPDRFFRPPPPRETLLDRSLLRKETAAAGGALFQATADPLGEALSGATKVKILAELRPSGRRALNIRIGAPKSE